MSLIIHGDSRVPFPSRLSRAVLSVAAGAVATVGRVISAEIDRRRTASLLGLDDHLLRDIGVTRGDVYASLLTSAGEKASHRLSRERDERRHASRTQVEEARLASGSSVRTCGTSRRTG